MYWGNRCVVLSQKTNMGIQANAVFKERALGKIKHRIDLLTIADPYLRHLKDLIDLCLDFS